EAALGAPGPRTLTRRIRDGAVTAARSGSKVQSPLLALRAMKGAPDAERGRPKRVELHPARLAVWRSEPVSQTSPRPSLSCLPEGLSLARARARHISSSVRR